MSLDGIVPIKFWNYVSVPLEDFEPSPKEFLAKEFLSQSVFGGRRLADSTRAAQEQG